MRNHIFGRWAKLLFLLAKRFCSASSTQNIFSTTVYHDEILISYAVAFEARILYYSKHIRLAVATEASDLNDQEYFFFLVALSKCDSVFSQSTGVLISQIRNCLFVVISNAFLYFPSPPWYIWQNRFLRKDHAVSTLVSCAWLVNQCGHRLCFIIQYAPGTLRPRLSSIHLHSQWTALNPAANLTKLHQLVLGFAPASRQAYTYPPVQSIPYCPADRAVNTLERQLWHTLRPSRSLFEKSAVTQRSAFQSIFRS